MRRFGAVLLVAATASLLLLTACSSGAAGGGGGSLTSLYVDPASGLDSNPGTKASPLKTIGKAVSLAKGGDTIVLMAGTYDEISGESWGYTVPAGVTLKGNTTGVVLQSNSHADGFTLSGDATVTGVTMKDFGAALSSSGGTLTMKNDTFTGNGYAAVLSSSAKATLATTDFTGSGWGLSLQDSASASVSGGTVDGIDGDAFDVSGSASLTLDGVQATGTHDDVVYLSQAATATISNCVFQDSSAQGSGGSSSVDLSGSSSVTLTDTSITGAYSNAVLSRDAGNSVVINGGSFSDNGGYGVESEGSLSVNGGSFDSNAYYGIVAVAGTAVISNAAMSYNARQGFYAEGSPTIKLRNDTLTDNSEGAVYLNSGSGSADFGTAGDPGGNTFQQTASGSVGLTVLWTNAAVQAVGDTWNASVQGADAGGHYSSQVLSGPLSGANITLVTGASLQL